MTEDNRPPVRNEMTIVQKKKWLLGIGILAIGLFLLFPPAIWVKDYSGTTFTWMFNLSRKRVDSLFLISIWFGIVLILALVWELIDIGRDEPCGAQKRNPFKILCALLVPLLMLGGMAAVSLDVDAQVLSLKEAIESVESDVADIAQTLE